MIGMGGTGGPRALLQSMGSQQDGRVRAQVIWRLLKFVGPHWKRLVVALLLMVITTATGLLVPYLTRVVIDQNIATGDLPGLWRNGLWLSLAMVVTYAAASGQTFILSVLAQKVLYSLRARLFAHLQRLSVAYHDTHIVGVTVSRVMNDVEVINNLVSEGLVTLVGDTLLLAGTIGIMLAMDLRLALVTFTILPVMVLATVIFSRRARVAFRDTREKVAALVGNLAQNIDGMRVIQSFVQEERSHVQFEKSNRKNRAAHVRAMSLSFVFLPSIDVLGVAATCIVLLAGGIMALRGAVTIGVIVAFMTYVNRFFVPIREMSQLFTTMQSASAGGERVLELLDTRPAVADTPDAVAISRPQGRIELEDVRFSYRPGIEVLHGVSLRADAGETIAVVGPTGAGKSTITNLICRFYDVSSGAVRIDGTDIRDITIDSLHRHMGYVSQDPILFQGTIAENIAFGAPEATEESIREASHRAGVEGFITSLADGLETRVFEGGANLSVGQRQLIAIARAMLVDAPMLIMDEATSSVDTVTESLIQQGLDELLNRRTAVVIAHRLTTVRNAGRIYVIEDGLVSATGSHDELMRDSEMYRGLYEKQFLSGSR